MSNPQVSIVMGSDSDLEIMREAGKALDEFGIPFEIDVTSAHRSPIAPPTSRARPPTAASGSSSLGLAAQPISPVSSRRTPRSQSSASRFRRLR